MCLLIVQPKGRTFSRADIRDFAETNADGFGIVRADGGALHAHTMVGKPEEVYALYMAHAAGRECVLHFRMATHGPATQENAHPYFITPEIAVAHNGILGVGNPIDAKRTDSWHFAEYFLKPIALSAPELLFTPAWLNMLGDMVGKSNRLAFIHQDGRIAVVNEARGERETPLYVG